MSNLDQVRSGVGRLWENLSDGWHQLRQRASQAVTRFNPHSKSGDVETSEEQVLQQTSRWGLLPADIIVDEAEIVVRLEAPGMEPGNFEIEVREGLLVVRGEKRLERERREGRYHLMERAYGSFERAIALPTEVDDSRAQARYKNGVLTITLQKSERARARRIEVCES